jgi:hypothetical protein
MIDTDYNEESFFVRHCYFTGGNDPFTTSRERLLLTFDDLAACWSIHVPADCAGLIPVDLPVDC